MLFLGDADRGSDFNKSVLALRTTQHNRAIIQSWNERAYPWDKKKLNHALSRLIILALLAQTGYYYEDEVVRVQSTS